MEKFTKWRDPGTGIQPFLPITKSNDDLNPIYRILNDYAFGPLFGLLKFFLILPILTVWFVEVGLVEVFIIGQLKWRVMRILDRYWGRLVLFLLGFWWLEEEKRVTIRTDTNETAGTSNNNNSKLLGFSLHSAKMVDRADDTVQPGDLIIANHSSYVDFIYFFYRFSPQCTLVDPIMPHKLYYYGNRMSLLFALFFGNFPMLPRRPATRQQLVNLGKLQEEAACPLLVFAEGTCTNGRAVLPFLADLSGISINQRIHLFSVKYANGLFSPAHPIGNTFLHLFRLCSQLSNSFNQVKWLTATAVYRSGPCIPEPDDVAFNRRLTEIVAQMGHQRVLGLSAVDKIAFNNKFSEK